MAESNVNVTEGSGKRLHTFNRTIGAVSVEDEFMLPGEFPYATYSVSVNLVATTTSLSHVMQIMAGASLNVRVRRIRIKQRDGPAAITVMDFAVLRLTTAGTGGTAITPRPYDTADAAAGATAQTLPTAKGTEGVFLWQEGFWFATAAIPATGSKDFIEWVQLPGSKPIIIPAGTTNGIAIKNTGAVAASSVSVDIEFVETNFV
jgi:hypothetical protein